MGIEPQLLTTICVLLKFQLTIRWSIFDQDCTQACHAHSRHQDFPAGGLAGWQSQNHAVILESLFRWDADSSLRQWQPHLHLQNAPGTLPASEQQVSIPTGTLRWYIYHILRTGFSPALCLNIPMHAEELKLSKPRKQHLPCTHSRDFRAHRMAAEASSSRRWSWHS